ncbi:MAG: hypothetical protein JJ891_06805 [Rhizobiaceae bacterium]|nr:hypothetical protein [Rhizobiaceae bacterium]
MNEKDVVLYKPVIPEISLKDYETLKEANQADGDRHKFIDENTLIPCIDQWATGDGCGHYNLVKDSILIRTYYYVSPHGCTGGDYYKPGELQTKCSNCGKVIRLYRCHGIESIPHSAFKSTEDSYDQ